MAVLSAALYERACAADLKAAVKAVDTVSEVDDVAAQSRLDAAQDLLRGARSDSSGAIERMTNAMDDAVDRPDEVVAEIVAAVVKQVTDSALQSDLALDAAMEWRHRKMIELLDV